MVVNLCWLKYQRKTPKNNLLNHINAAKNPQSSCPTGFPRIFHLIFYLSIGLTNFAWTYCPFEKGFSILLTTSASDGPSNRVLPWSLAGMPSTLEPSIPPLISTSCL